MATEQGKPTPQATIEQVAWVLRCLTKNCEGESGTFRNLIYDIMGFGDSAYEPLFVAGGLEINNALRIHRRELGFPPS